MPAEHPRRRLKLPLHLGRAREILGVFFKYGFGDVLAALPLQKYFGFARRFRSVRKAVGDGENASRPERIRKALEELGPTFVKLGQFVASRPDLLPPEYIEELEKLHDAVAPFPTVEAKALILKELGPRFDARVASLDEKPLAAASIAQVHRARLASGEEIVFKVQRPGIRETMTQDLGILRTLAQLAERNVERARPFRPRQLVDEFERMLLQELDFEVEAAHFETFRRNFKGEREILIPKVHRDLTSKRLLVTEFIDAPRINDLAAIHAMGLAGPDLAKRGARLILTQLFDHGYFHADPHPGNILVLADGRLCFLDFGAMGLLTPETRRQLSLILFGVAMRDPRRVVRVLLELSGRPHGNLGDLEHEVAEFIEDYSTSSLQNLRVGEVLRRFADIILKHQLRIIPGFYLLVKSLVAIEGVAQRLDPDFNLVAHITPFITRHVLAPPDLRKLPFEAHLALTDLMTLLRDLPSDAKDLVRTVKAGELRIQFEHRGLGPVLAKGDQLVSRLSFSIVLASLIVGSSIVLHAAAPPVVYGISVIGLAGFALAGLIGFGLLFSILRNRRW